MSHHHLPKSHTSQTQRRLGDSTKNESKIKAEDMNVASAVTRYTSDLYRVPSPSNIDTNKSPDCPAQQVEQVSSTNTIHEDSQRIVDQRSSGKSTLSIPYDEAMGATGLTTNDSRYSPKLQQITQTDSKMDYDIQERIRRLKQYKEERQQRISGNQNVRRISPANCSNSDYPRSFSNSSMMDNDSSTSHDVHHKQYPMSMNAVKHNQSSSSVPPKVRDMRKSNDLQQKQHTSINQRAVLESQKSTDQQLTNNRRNIAETHSQASLRHQQSTSSISRLTSDVHHTQQGPMSPMTMNSGVDPIHKQGYSILVHESQVYHTGSINSQNIFNGRITTKQVDATQVAQRQRSKSLPPENRHTSGLPRVPATAFDNTISKACDSQNSAIITTLEYGGRKAEIETPSVACVRELREKLWTPNEQLNVSIQPSLHIDPDEVQSKYSILSSDDITSKFNRHWLHYNGPEMAGTRGQRTARSLSPKNLEKHRSFLNDSNFLETRHPNDRNRNQETIGAMKSVINNNNSDTTTSSGRTSTTKSILFKSRYFEAAQRGLTIQNHRGDFGAMSSASTEVTNCHDGPVMVKCRESSVTKQETAHIVHSTKGAEQTKDHIPLNDNKRETQSSFTNMYDGSVREAKTFMHADQSTTLYKTNNIKKVKEDFNALNERKLSEEKTTATTSSSTETNKNEDYVSSLIAKLGAIRRDDPHAALEQIDAVLRAESSKSGIISSPNAKEAKQQQQVVDNDTKNRFCTSSSEVYHGKRVKDIENMHVLSYKSLAHELVPKNSVQNDDINAETEHSDEDESCFDETTVSSITNPTYLSATINSPENGTQPQSTLAAGRPRPSNLQVYTYTTYHRQATIGSTTQSGATTCQDGRASYDGMLVTTSNNLSSLNNESSRVYKYRPQRDRSPLPDSFKGTWNSKEVAKQADVLHVQESISRGAFHENRFISRDSPRGNNFDGESDHHEITKRSELNRDDKRLSLKYNVHVESQKNSDTPQTIRQFDNTRSGIVTNMNSSSLGSTWNRIDGEDNNSILQRSISPKREHPWESALPSIKSSKIDVRDTSMEGETGLEITVKDAPKNNLHDSIPLNWPSTSQVQRIYNNRIMTEMQPGRTQPMENSNTISTAREDIGRDESNENDVKNEEAERTRLISPWYHENTKVLSDDFDAAWVNLPSSSFFDSDKINSDSGTTNGSFGHFFNDDDTKASNRATIESRQSKKQESFPMKSRTYSQIPPVSSELPQRSGLPAIDHVTSDIRKSLTSNMTPSKQNESLLNTTSLPPSSSSKRGRLRGFLARKGTGSNADQGSTCSGMGSTLTADRQSIQSKNKSQYDVNTDPEIKQPRKSSQTTTPHSPSRGRRPSTSTTFRSNSSRERAKSLDERRIRSPSIAKKFGRLIGVYDSEATADIQFDHQDVCNLFNKVNILKL